MLKKLREMPKEDGPWCDTPPPTDDMDALREWLREEVRQLPVKVRYEEGVEALCDELLDALGKPDLALPPPPSAALRLYEMLQDEEISIHSVLEELKQEPALVQQVWSQASSAHFATPPRDLQYAVARVGLRELSRIAAAEVVSARTFKIHAFKTRAENTRYRSILASELASSYSPRRNSTAYLSGLLHAVGSLLVLRTAPIETPALDRMIPSILRRFEAPMGMLALSNWSLPDSVVQAVGYQCVPGDVPAELQALTRLTRAVSIAAHGAEMMMAKIDCGALEALAALDGLDEEPAVMLYEAHERLKRLHE